MRLASNKTIQNHSGIQIVSSTYQTAETPTFQSSLFFFVHLQKAKFRLIYLSELIFEPSITGRLKHNPDDQLAVFDEESQTVVLVTRKYFEQVIGNYMWE